MTVLVKKHRHIRLLGQIDGQHLHSVPKDYRGENEEKLDLFTQALAGDPSGLLKILNAREKDRLFSYLNNLRHNG